MGKKSYFLSETKEWLVRVIGGRTKQLINFVTSKIKAIDEFYITLFKISLSVILVFVLSLSLSFKVIRNPIHIVESNSDYLITLQVRYSGTDCRLWENNLRSHFKITFFNGGSGYIYACNFLSTNKEITSCKEKAKEYYLANFATSTNK